MACLLNSSDPAFPDRQWQGLILGVDSFISDKLQTSGSPKGRTKAQQTDQPTLPKCKPVVY